MFCQTHDHPRRIQPITKRMFAKEFVALARKADIQCTCTIDFSAELADEHERNPRRYADVLPDDFVFRFAPQVLWLPRVYRQGLIAHEIGHVICKDLPRGGTEADADQAALEHLGVLIRYDRRWPGKGLQVAR